MEKVKLREKLGYGAGEMAINLAYQTISLNLMIFYTDQFGLKPWEASLVFLFGKLWDALANPLMGLIVDRTKTRWGSKRPFLLAGSLPLGAAFFLMFLVPPLTGGLLFAYALGAYLLFSTFIAMVSIPHGSLTASMTLDSQERSGISAVRMAFGLVGTLVAGGLSGPLTGVVGTQGTALIFGALMALGLSTVFFTVKERVEAPKEAFSFKDALQTIKTNKPFQILALSSLILTLALNLLAVNLEYYFKYFQEDPLGKTLAFACLLLSALAVMPLFNYLSKRFSKRLAFQIGLGAISLALLALFFIGKAPLWAVLPVFVVSGCGMAVMFLSPWSMIPDTVEYSQWKTGQRREGALYGLFYLVFKLSSALSGFIQGIMLTAVAYKAPIKDVPQVQTPEALTGILTMETLVPVGLFLLGMGLLMLYPINKKFHEKILSELNWKKE